jgi:glutamate formiminotransferase
MLECVINISEGRRVETVDLIARNAGEELLDVHVDRDHNRSVLTLVGEQAARGVAAATVLALDIHQHQGVHPRFGVLDVVPFVPLGSTTMDDAVAARNRFSEWLASGLGVPCFLYGPERTLPEVRRRAFVDLLPDIGPSEPHPSAGATAVGARAALVAYNLWLTDDDIDAARRIAALLRGPSVRALGLQVGDHVQVSMNLVDPLVTGPAQVYDVVRSHAAVARAELVGLIPRALLARTPPTRWPELGLSEDQTIETRLAARGVQID